MEDEDWQGDSMASLRADVIAERKAAAAAAEVDGAGSPPTTASCCRQTGIPGIAMSATCSTSEARYFGLLHRVNDEHYSLPSERMMQRLNGCIPIT